MSDKTYQPRRPCQGSDPKKAWKLAGFLAVCAILAGSGALGSRGVLGAAEDESPDDTPGAGQDVVYVIPIRGEIEKGLSIVLNRALREAARDGAKAIVLDMRTPGGRVDSAMIIRDRLIESPIEKYTYVNNMAISAGAFIALATQTIIMAPNSNIGGALPITIGPEGPGAVDEKFISVFASEMRKTAKHNGHPVDIAEAFSNPDIVIEGIKEKGKILTLDYEQAVEVKLAKYVSPTLEAMLKTEGLGSARIVRFRETGTDKVARFLASPVILGILMMLGTAGLIFEIRTPGLGLPGLVGVTALGLYFFGAYLANLSGYMEMIFFVLGLILLIVEIFVIPGFGVFGIAGLGLMIGSLFFALFNMPPQGFEFTIDRLRLPVWVMLTAIITFVPLFIFVGRIFPHTPLYGALMLKPPAPRASSSSSAAVESAPSDTVEPGQIGEAKTDLRPSGTALIEGRRVDVVTEGEFVPRGSPIVVHRVEGSRIVIRPRSDA